MTMIEHRGIPRPAAPMNPSRIFILRPVATTLLMAAILLAGGVAYSYLPLSALPEVDYPTIEVQTFLPGASPEVMTSSVTAPLERQLGQMPGLNQMTSASSAGASVITLQFSLNLSLDIAEQEVQAAINAANNLLPSGLPTPPVYNKVNPADAPVMTLSVTSKTLPLTTLEDISETRLCAKTFATAWRRAGQHRRRPAARRADQIQSRRPRRLWPQHRRSAHDDRQRQRQFAERQLRWPAQASTINANDQIRDAAGYGPLVVAYRNGSPVRLSDIASVGTGPENSKLGALDNTTPAIILSIRRQPGANVIEVVDTIKQLLPTIVANLPPAVDVKILSDRTTTIRASVADVEFELALAVALVVVVIFLFLRTLPATIIPSLSVPLSLVGTFVAMYLLGFSLDNLSLMALTISTGFVVDDAIVMIENIARYIEAGDPPLEAALKGSEQIGFTIISLTVSLIAVLIPLLFMGDVVGRLFHEFAITLAVTIVISAFVSLTLVPMLCARLIRHRPAASRNRFDLMAERAFNGLVERYGRALDVVLAHQPLTLFVAIATLGLTIILYIVIPKGFFPVQDTGMIVAISEAPQNVSFGAMAGLQRQLADAILRDPAVENVSSFIGIDGENPTLNSGRFLINLKPKDKRQLTASEIVRRLQKEVSGIVGVSLYMQPVQDLTIDTSVSRAQYHFILQDADPAAFKIWVPKLVQRLRQLPELSDVASDLQSQGLAVDLTIDRATAARFGITPASVDNALYDAFGQRIISTIYTQSNQYRVILEADPALQRTLSSLSSFYLPSSSSSTNGQVPLSAIVHVNERSGPLLITHLAQFPATTISFNVARGSSLGAAVKAIEKAEQEAGLPDSFISSFQGAAAAFRASTTNELLLIIAAVITMYIVLGVLYESFIHPITILSTLPSAGVGALLALMATGHELDVIAIIGIVLLIGIVKKNAIMMIDFALQAERSEGLAPRDAIFQACLLRFRPILMTTFAAILGALPLMLGTGTGSELRNPLGVAIVGGLIVSQVLTLFTTPVIYLYFDRLAVRFGRGRGGSRPLAAGETRG